MSLSTTAVKFTENDKNKNFHLAWRQHFHCTSETGSFKAFFFPWWFQMSFSPWYSLMFCYWRQQNRCIWLHFSPPTQFLFLVLNSPKLEQQRKEKNPPKMLIILVQLSYRTPLTAANCSSSRYKMLLWFSFLPSILLHSSWTCIHLQKRRKRYRWHWSYCTQHKRGKSGDGTEQRAQNQKNQKLVWPIFLNAAEFLFGERKERRRRGVKFSTNF